MCSHSCISLRNCRPLCPTTGALWFRPQKTAEFPQLQFLMVVGHPFHVANADTHGPDHSADHRVSKVAVLPWWSMFLLAGCADSSLLSVCRQSRLVVFSLRLRWLGFAREFVSRAVFLMLSGPRCAAVMDQKDSSLAVACASWCSPLECAALLGSTADTCSASVYEDFWKNFAKEDFRILRSILVSLTANCGVRSCSPLLVVDIPVIALRQFPMVIVILQVQYIDKMVDVRFAGPANSGSSRVETVEIPQLQPVFWTWSFHTPVVCNNSCPWSRPTRTRPP